MRTWALLLALAPAVLGDSGTGAGIVDLHCHLAGLGAGGSGCFVSSRLRRNPRFLYYLRAMGVGEKEVLREGDGIVADRLSESLAGSRRVSRAVILALDGVVANGELDADETEAFVPDSFVEREAARHPILLFGASVNPYRKDALERLRRAKGRGAVLVKWIPSVMRIDPADESLKPFYRELAALGLPLLVHTGRERSFTRAQDELSDPARLKLPLSLGVKVIAAHAAANGRYGGEEGLDRLRQLMAAYPKLYADISSLTQVNRLGHLPRVMRDPLVRSRLVYGSDWPLQSFPVVSPLFFAGRIGPGRALRLSRINNPWDRDVALKEALGVGEDAFLRGETLLFRNPPR
jgi:hypothetical protein